MGPDIAINVEVTISDELRRLLGVPLRDAPKSEPVVPADAAEAPASAPEPWQDIILRRDGQRPLIFRGLPIVTRRCVSDDLLGQTEQTLALYLAEDQTLVAALAYEPPSMALARPAHRCQTIESRGDFQAFVTAWAPDHWRAAARGTTHTPTASLLAVRTAFTSMAADCLSMGMLQA